jgi:hypothetical protein
MINPPLIRQGDSEKTNSDFYNLKSSPTETGIFYPNFATMTRKELRQYILEHREDDEAVSIYAERFRDPNAKVYRQDQGFNDLEVAMELRKRLEWARNQA